MAKKIAGLIGAIVVMLSIMGGTCQSTYMPDRPSLRRPSNAGRGEEATSLVRITSKPAYECSPDISPNGEEIAFESWEAGGYNNFGDFDIWIVGADGGGGFQRVTNSPVNDFYPSWFPDGKRLLFTSMRGGYPSIWAKATSGLGGTQKISWTGTYDYSGDVSNDGNFIVFSRGDQFTPSFSEISNHLFYPPRPWAQIDESLWFPRIYRMDVSGARVTDLGPGFDPKLSPDGKKIAYTSFKSGTYDIWVMNIDGKNRTQITSYGGQEISPCWSPDGNWIAYSKSAPSYFAKSYKGNNYADYWNIWIVNVNTGENFQKTFQHARDLGPSWGYVKCANGYKDYIYFHSDRDDFATTGFDIYRLDPDMGVEGYDLPDLASITPQKKPSVVAPKGNKAVTMKKPRIKVLNSTQIAGWAKQVAEELKSKGYIIVDYGNTKHEKNLPFTKIYYRDGFRRAAADIALEIMPGKQYIYSQEELSDVDMIVVLGGTVPKPKEETEKKE